MRITMRVNGVSTHPQHVEVSFNGEKAMAQISMVEVELHDEETGHGSMSIRANKPGEVTRLREMFIPGSMVTFDTDSFEVMPPPAPPPEAVSQEAPQA